MALSWFGVKTLFRSRAVGRSRGLDSAFDPGVDCVEERVVLFRARTFDNAIARAETDARRYAKVTHRNPYGQTVVTAYLGSCDAFKLFESPAAGIEVFSSTVLVPASEPRRALVDRWFGPPERIPDKRRRKFLNRGFSGEVRAASNKALQPKSPKARRQRVAARTKPARG